MEWGVRGVTERISPYEYVWLVAGFVIGTAALIFVGGQVGKDAWLVVITGFMEAAIMSLAFLCLSRRFPGMGVSGINDAVWGKYIGKLFTCAFIWYALTLSFIVVNNFANFIQLTLLNGIPDYPLDMVTSAILTIAVLYGIEVIGRFTAIIVPLIILIVLIVTILSTPYMDPNNIRPILATPLPKLLSTTHSLATFPFGEVVIFAAVIPFLSNPERSIRYSLTGMIIAACTFILITMRNIAILGDAPGFFSYVSYTVSRIINVSGFFTRMELFVALNYVLTSGIKGAILLYAASVTAKDMLKLKTMTSIALAFGLLMMIFRHHTFPSSVHNFVYAERIYPFYALPFEFILPLITLLAAIIRKKKGDALPQE